jgi:hypothetical protein
MRGDTSCSQSTIHKRRRPNGTAFYNRRTNHAHKGDCDRAIQDFCQAIRLKPTAPAFYNRGIAYAAAGDYIGLTAQPNAPPISKMPDALQRDRIPLWHCEIPPC